MPVDFPQGQTLEGRGGRVLGGPGRGRGCNCQRGSLPVESVHRGIRARILKRTPFLWVLRAEPREVKGLPAPRPGPPEVSGSCSSKSP